MNRKIFRPDVFFSVIMRLYPRAFRDEFGEEMAGVFAEKMGDERKAGWARRISSGLRELADLTVQALVERAEGRFGKENPMSKNLHRVRIFAVLSPVMLAVFLVIINPRYVWLLFSDPIGWEGIAAIMLGLGISLMVWSAPPPASNGRRIVQEFVLVFTTLIVDLLIILGPAFVMAFGASSPSAIAREYNPTLRWVMLAVDGVLAGVVILLAVKRLRRERPSLLKKAS